ncbi:MAG: hypothetical protein ACRDJF_12505 [Actinomycetota bacterium]
MSSISVRRLLTLGIALVSGAAGVIHLGAAVKHLEHPFLAGAFLGMGIVQTGLAGLLVARPSRQLLKLALMVTALIVGVWVLTRLTAVPGVPGLEVTQPIGVDDAIATFLEVALLGAGGFVLSLPDAPVAGMRGGRRVLGALGATVLGLATVGVAAPHESHAHRVGALTSVEHSHEGELAGIEHPHDDGDGAAHTHDQGPAPSEESHHGPLTWEQATEALVAHGHPAHRTATLAEGGVHDSGAGHQGGGSSSEPDGHDPGVHANHSTEEGAAHSSHAAAAGKCSPAAERDKQVLLQDPTNPNGWKTAYQPATPDGCRGSTLLVPALGPNPNGEHHTHSGECTPTPQQQASADKLVADTKAALAKYLNNPQQALADGFVAYPVPLTKWFHMFNYERFEDGHVLSPEHIESFMYGMTDDGLSPIGGMYIFVPRDQQPPDPTGCLMQWHKHSQVGTSLDPEHLDESMWMAHVFLQGDIDPWGRDYDGSEPHTWFWAYRNIPVVCDTEGFCV